MITDTMPRADAATTDDTPTVVLDSGGLVICNLTVHGAAADAARRRVADGGNAEECVRQMLDVGGTVLEHGANSTLVQAVVAEIRGEALAREAVRAVEARVASKGLRYEELVRPVLEAAFAPFGDLVEATGSVPGFDGKSKKGDFVATLDPATIAGRDRRVVIEAKDVPTQKLAGKTGALAYLAAAMENRVASAGVLVCAVETPALAGHRLRVYAGNRILVRYDKDDGDGLALEVACQLARAFAARSRAGDDGASTEAMVEQVARLREVIERAKEVHGGVLEARRGIKRVDDAYETMRAEALAVLGELEERLAE